MFIIGKILAALVFPPGIFIALAAACAILAIKNKRKAAAIVAILDALLLYALSTGAVSSLLIAPLENGYPPIIASDDARAIVVLGGGYNDSSPERGGAGSLDSGFLYARVLRVRALEEVRTAAGVHRRGAL